MCITHCQSHKFSITSRSDLNLKGDLSTDFPMNASLIRLSVIVLVHLTWSSISYAEPDRVFVPNRFPPHPRLFTNEAEINKLQGFLNRHPEENEVVQSLIKKCENQLASVPTPPQTIDSMENREISIYARDMAISYILTGRVEFAEAASRVLLSYADVYPGYAITETKGKAMPSTLNEARWAIDLAMAYDLIFNTGTLTESDKHRIEECVFVPCGEVLRICNHKTRSNWRARAIAGLGVVGFCIGNREFIDEAINGHFSEKGQLLRNGFVQHLQDSILGDGIFYERSFGYHAYTTDSYFLLMEAARHSNVDLWNLKVSPSERDAGADKERRFGRPGPKTVKPLFDALFYRTFSDGAVTNVANATADCFQPRRYYESAWRIWRDPKYALAARLSPEDPHPWDETLVTKKKRISDPADIFWIEPSLPDGHFSLGPNTTIGNSGIHENSCTLFPNGGFAILRESTAPDAICAEMNFGNWGSGHSHADKLSIVVSDGNRKIIREVNYFGYADDRYLTWDRQTIAHNTITVDEISQLPQAATADPWPVPQPGTTVHGRPVFFYPGKRLKAFRAKCDDAYPGIHLTRTIALVDSIIIDFYSAQSTSTHKYDYVLHVDADPLFDQHSLAPSSPFRLSDKYGYRHIEFHAQGNSPSRVTLDGEASIRLLSPSTVYLGNGIANKQGKSLPVILLRQVGDSATFITAFDFKRSHSLKLLHSGKDLQSVQIGDDLILKNSSEYLELLDVTGTLVERASSNKVK